MDDRRFRAEIVAAVFAGEGIDGVGAQFAAPRSFGRRCANRFCNRDLIHADRRMHEKRRHARVLANRAFVFLRHVDVRGDDVHRLRRLRAGLLLTRGDAHRGAHIGRQIGRCLRNEFEKTAFQELHWMGTFMLA